MRRLETDVFPWIGARPITDLAASDLIKIIERIEQRGALDLAKRVHNYVGRIFRYAVGRGLATRDPSRDIELKYVLPTTHVRHHASVTDPKAVGGLLRAMDGFTGAFTTRCALPPRLPAFTFVRSGELRHAEWTEIDYDKAEWRIPAGKMKMKRSCEDARFEAASLLFPEAKGEKAVEMAYATYREMLSARPSKSLKTMLPRGTPLI